MQGSNGEADTENRHGYGERGGEDEMYGESSMETYITICKIDSQWEFSVCLRNLKQGLCVKLEGLGWGGRWERDSKGRIYMYT